MHARNPGTAFSTHSSVAERPPSRRCELGGPFSPPTSIPSPFSLQTLSQRPLTHLTVPTSNRGLPSCGPVAVSRDLLEAAPAIPNIDYWFDPEVIAQLSSLLQAIDEFGVSPAFLRVVFSSIVNAVSHQESETRYRRVDREVNTSDVLARFRARLRRSLAMAEEFEAVVAPGVATARVACCDARALDVAGEEALCDLAVFSPPYPNAFDYHLYHRFRLFWLGYDPRQLKHSEIGAHLRYQSQDAWPEDMRESLGEVSNLLRPDALCVVIVGNGIIAGESVLSGDILWDLGASVDLTPTWRTTRPLAKHRRSFNLSDGRLLNEDVLVFRR
jgi:hypothetical protein